VPIDTATSQRAYGVVEWDLNQVMRITYCKVMLFSTLTSQTVDTIFYILSLPSNMQI